MGRRRLQTLPSNVSFQEAAGPPPALSLPPAGRELAPPAARCEPCRSRWLQSAPVSCGRARRRQSQLFVTLLAGVHIYNRIIGKRKEPRHYRAPRCLHSFYGPRWHHPSAGSRGCRVTAVLKTEAAASLGGCNFQRGDEILFFVRVATSAERGRGSEAIPMSSHCVSGRAGGRAGILRAPGCQRAQKRGLGASEKKNKLAFWHFCRQSRW